MVRLDQRLGAVLTEVGYAPAATLTSELAPTVLEHRLDYDVPFDPKIIAFGKILFDK